MLFHFESLPGSALARHVELDGERIVDRREFVAKLHIHNRADDLNDFAFIHGEILKALPGFSGMGQTS
jgi:hypothetical protein